MTSAELVPLIAALLCLEVSVAFAVLYAKVSRRKADLIFSVLSFCLAWLTWSAFMYASPTMETEHLFWLRMQYIGNIAALTVLIQFVTIVVRQPMRPPILLLSYLLGGLLIAVVACSDLYLIGSVDRLPSHPSPDEPSMTRHAAGPCYQLFTGMLVAGALAAGLKLMTGIRQRAQEGDSSFAPLAAHVRVIVAGALLVILGGATIILHALVYPGSPLPVNPQSIGVIAFCLLTAVALGKETLRGESEKERLADLIRFRDQAVRDVAHELKNPLAAIQGTMATVLHSGDRLELSIQRELLEMGVDSAKRLTRLLNNMLDTARLEAGREVELRIEDTDVPTVVESVLASQRTTTETHRLQFTSELAISRAPVDADKLHQIVFNLVNNAIKYSPDGGEVLVRLERANGDLRLIVRDQGIGMTPEQQARLFQPFERVVDAKRKITGTGIGLHLVKRLVEAHGGRISVESEFGKGSTFAVIMPVVDHGPPQSRRERL